MLSKTFAAKSLSICNTLALTYASCHKIEIYFAETIGIHINYGEKEKYDLWRKRDNLI